MVCGLNLDRLQGSIPCRVTKQEKEKNMRLTEIDVPEGCKKIYVDIEDGNVSVYFASKNEGNEFFCRETGQMEERPSVGDFAVFWNKEFNPLAVVANLNTPTGNGWMGSDGVLYDEAVKFRDYKQYLAIKGVYGE